ncbi:MAG TPA: hypothetical protein VHT27_13395 [Solirubrobacteraceae bacterium]|nr:hypothetical protein [Solirubrobacteraceae bacterium]
MALLVLALPAASALAEETAVKYTNEGQQAYEHQLAAGEIESATFNKRIRSLHLTLKNGQHMRYKYPPKTEKALVAALEAKKVPVSVLSAEAAKKEASKAPVKHKLRYIAGGIVIVVVVIVAAVLMLDRRRKRLAEE